MLSGGPVDRYAEPPRIDGQDPSPCRIAVVPPIELLGIVIGTSSHATAIGVIAYSSARGGVAFSLLLGLSGKLYRPLRNASRLMTARIESRLASGIAFRSRPRRSPPSPTGSP